MKIICKIFGYDKKFDYLYYTMKETQTNKAMETTTKRTMENENYEVSSELTFTKNDDMILTVYVLHKGLKIVSDTFQFTQLNEDCEFYGGRLNEFIDFITKVEKLTEIEELTYLEDIDYLFNVIEQNYFTRYLENC